MSDIERLTYWNCKEKGSALPVSINDDGDVVDLETLCAKLAAYEDTKLSPDDIQEAVDLFSDIVPQDEIPKEMKSWVGRCTWHVKKCNEYAVLVEELKRINFELELRKADHEDRVEGHWEHHKIRWGKSTMICSQCKSMMPIAFNYCPNCGAKMKE